MKTKQEWEASGLDLDDYLSEPCEIDEDLYMYIIEVVPPYYSGWQEKTRGLFQGGDAVDGIEPYYQDDEINRYTTVSEINDKYFYLGVLPEFKQ